MYNNNNYNKHTFQNKPLKQWDSNDISSWLTSIGMKLYISIFKSENITGKQLRKFTEDDLRTKCKITARPIRKILLKRLKHIQGKWKTEDSDDEEEVVEKKEEDEDNNQDSLLNDLDDDDSHENPIDENKKETIENDGIDDSKRILTAVFIIKSMYQCWKARQIVLSLIENQYIKVYSLQTGRYVYKFIGRDTTFTDTGEMYKVFSPLAPTEPLTRKPINLGSADLSIQFTLDLAAARIQLFARYCHTIRRVRSLVRQRWRRMTDTVSGKEFFYHPPSGCKRWTKPKLLGNERWDPMDMRLWTVQDVQFYFHKLRVDTSIIRAIEQHKVNGSILLLFEGEDLDRLGLPNDELKRIILYDIEHVINRNKPYLFKLNLIRKRDRFRYNYRIVQATIIIQRKIRQFIVKSKFSRLNDILSRRREESLSQNQIWWSHHRFQLVTVFKDPSGEPQKVTIPF